MRTLCLALVVVGFSSCLDVCKRAELIATSFPKRHAACIAQDTLPGPSFDAKACSASMKVCSASDEQALQKYLDCVEQLPVCTPETRSSFNEKFLTCASGMGQLSAGCFVP